MLQTTEKQKKLIRVNKLIKWGRPSSNQLTLTRYWNLILIYNFIVILQMVYFPREVLDIIFIFDNPFVEIEKELEEVYRELFF